MGGGSVRWGCRVGVLVGGDLLGGDLSCGVLVGEDLLSGGSGGWGSG